MRVSILLCVLIICFISCQKKQSSTTIVKPQDSVAGSPYSRVDVYIGQTIDSQVADGCGTQTKVFNEIFTVSYLKADSTIVITGNAYTINNPCTHSDDGYKSYTYSRMVSPSLYGRYQFLNDMTHVYETIVIKNDSFYINIQNWRCNTNDNCYFRGKRKQ